MQILVPRSRVGTRAPSSVAGVWDYLYSLPEQTPSPLPPLLLQALNKSLGMEKEREREDEIRGRANQNSPGFRTIQLLRLLLSPKSWI